MHIEARDQHDDSTERSSRTPGIGDKRVIFQNEFITLYAVKAHFGTFEKEYFVTDDGVSTGVLALCDDEVLLVRQYRFLIDGLGWEIPGGKVDKGELPESAAARECLEETGYECRDLGLLIKCDPSLDVRWNPTHLYYSHEQVKSAEILNEVEEVHWVPFAKCLEMIYSGEITHVYTICALLTYANRFGVPGVGLKYERRGRPSG